MAHYTIQREVDRKCTVNLDVIRDGKVEIDEIFTAINNRNYLQLTKCLQQVTRNKFRWSLVNEDEAKNIVEALDITPLRIGPDEIQAHYASRYKTFFLYDTPYEIEDKDLKEIFSYFGEIFNIRRCVHKTWPNILDGRIIITFSKLSHDPPEHILLGKSGKITIREPGERVRRMKCYKCGQVDSHEPKDCPGDTICHHCGEEGHRRNACPHKEQPTPRETYASKVSGDKGNRNKTFTSLKKSMTTNATIESFIPGYMKKTVTNANLNEEGEGNSTAAESVIDETLNKLEKEGMIVGAPKNASTPHNEQSGQRTWGQRESDTSQTSPKRPKKEDIAKINLEDSVSSAGYACNIDKLFNQLDQEMEAVHGDKGRARSTSRKKKNKVRTTSNPLPNAQTRLNKLPPKND